MAEIRKNNPCGGGIFEHRFRLQSLKKQLLCRPYSLLFLTLKNNFFLNVVHCKVNVNYHLHLHHQVMIAVQIVRDLLNRMMSNQNQPKNRYICFISKRYYLLRLLGFLVYSVGCIVLFSLC